MGIRLRHPRRGVDAYEYPGCVRQEQTSCAATGINAQSPPRRTTCNSPPINGQCTIYILFDVAESATELAWHFNDMLVIILLYMYICYNMY